MYGEPKPLPVAGEYVRLDWIYGAERWPGHEVLYLLAGPWEGSDYSGYSFAKSNQRVILKDFPGTFIQTGGDHGAFGLAVPLDFGDSAAAGTLLRLVNEHPIVDEDDYDQLLCERVAEAWDGYLQHDLACGIESLTGRGVDLSAHMQDFYDLLSEHEIYPDPDGPAGVRLRGIDNEEFLLALARRATRAGRVGPAKLRQEIPATNIAAIGRRSEQERDGQEPSL